MHYSVSDTINIMKKIRRITKANAQALPIQFHIQVIDITNRLHNLQIVIEIIPRTQGSSTRQLQSCNSAITKVDKPRFHLIFTVMQLDSITQQSLVRYL